MDDITARSKNMLWPRLMMPLAIVCLAAAIAYVGWVVNRLVSNLPSLLAQVENVAQRIDTIEPEINAVTQQVPEILERIDQIDRRVPDILARVDVLQEQLPDVLASVDGVQSQIPPLLSETAALRAELPAILNEVADVRAAIPPVLAELAAYREVIPGVVDEVAAVRTSVPPTLDRVDAIVANADEAGRRVTEGAATGLFTGLFKMPFALMRNLRDSVFKGSHLDESEQEKVLEQINYLLVEGKPGDTVEWKSADGRYKEALTLSREFKQSGQTCREIIARPGKQMSPQLVVCQDADGQWQLSK